MTEFQDQQIRLTIKTLIVWAIGIVSIVSSFWIGYGSIMNELTDIKYNINTENRRVDNEIERAKIIHEDIYGKIIELQKKVNN